MHLLKRVSRRLGDGPVSESPPLSSDSDLMEIEKDPANPIPSTSLGKHRKDRPPTIGEYVRLAAAKERLIATKQEESELQLEEEAWKSTAELRAMDRLGADLNLQDMVDRASKAADVVLKVATTSRHLQGRYVKILKDAAQMVRNVAGEIHKLTLLEDLAKAQRPSREPDLLLEKRIRTVKEKLRHSKAVAEISSSKIRN